MPATTATRRPRLTTTPAPSTPNTWIAYNHDEVLGRIHRDHSHNFYYMVKSSQPSQRFGILSDAVSSLYKARQQAKLQHEQQITSELESITSNWGHTPVPGTKRVTTTSQINTVVIDGTTCVKTAHGYIGID